MRTALKISKGIELLDSLGDTKIEIEDKKIAVTLKNNARVTHDDASRLAALDWLYEDSYVFPKKFVFKHDT